MFHQSDADEGSSNTAHKGAFCPNFTLILMFVIELAIVCLLTFQPGHGRHGEFEPDKAQFP